MCSPAEYRFVVVVVVVAVVEPRKWPAEALELINASQKWLPLGWTWIWLYPTGRSINICSNVSRAVRHLLLALSVGEKSGCCRSK